MEFAALFPTAVLIAAGGLAVGFLVGITGVGAGALTTPMLISGFGVAPAVAVGTDLLFAAITKGSAAFRHHSLGNVNWPILKWMALGSVTGAVATLGSLYILEPDVSALGGSIKQALAVALVCSAIAIPIFPLLAKRKTGADETAPVAARPTFTVIFGFVLGVLVALTSIGAGAIGVAVLTLLYPALQARRVVGTDIVHAIPLALVSGLGHVGMGHIDFAVLGYLLIGSIPGIMLGSRVTGWIPDWLLRIVLSVVLLYAAYLLVGGIGH